MGANLALLACVLSAETLAQSVDNALSGRAFHPLIASEAPSPAVAKAEEEASAQIRKSLEGGAYCNEGVCIQAPPLPTSPASEVSDYVAEQKFASYVLTVNKIEACDNAACAKQVVDQAVGVTKIAPQEIQ